MFGKKKKVMCVICDGEIDPNKSSAVTKTGEPVHEECFSEYEKRQAKQDAFDKLKRNMHKTTAASLVGRETLTDKGYVQAQYALGLATFTGHFSSEDSIAGRNAPKHEGLLNDAMERCIERLVEAAATKEANALLNLQVTPHYMTGNKHTVLVVSAIATAAVVSEAEVATLNAVAV